MDGTLNPLQCLDEMDISMAVGECGLQPALKILTFIGLQCLR